MRAQLLAALAAAPRMTLTELADAFEAAIHAAHTNNPAHGYNAAIEKLQRVESVDLDLDDPAAVEKFLASSPDEIDSEPDVA